MFAKDNVKAELVEFSGTKNEGFRKTKFVTLKRKKILEPCIKA
jgi:hypothetical protein